MVSSYCTIGDIPRVVVLAKNPMQSYESGMEGGNVAMTNETYRWSFETQIFHSGYVSLGGDRNTLEVMTNLIN